MRFPRSGNKFPGSGKIITEISLEVEVRMKMQTEGLYFIKVQKTQMRIGMSKINEQIKKRIKISDEIKGRTSSKEVFGV